jgi:hypothetical protein
VHNLSVLRYLLVEKGLSIPDYAVIREEGTVNEKKLSLRDLLVESGDTSAPKQKEQYNEILSFLNKHGN